MKIEVPRSQTHFGERVIHGKYGFNLDRSRYAYPDKRITNKGIPREMRLKSLAPYRENYEDDEMTIYTDEHVAFMQERALRNFDLSMAYFTQLDSENFRGVVAALPQRFPRLKEIKDLKNLDDREGLYVMVLGAYKQIYVGQSTNMRRRIKAHWSGTKKLDRTVYGDVETSILSIDAFRAFDTTQIFAVCSMNVDRLEEQLIREIPSEFLANRMHGGRLLGDVTDIQKLDYPERRLVP